MAIGEQRKQKAKHELQEMLLLFGYLAFFFCALTIYDLLLLRQYHIKYWNFGFALINALVITKVIMIGEYAKVGRRHENKPLLVSIFWKSLIFGVLVYAFHIVEEIFRRVVHGADVAGASRDVRLDNLLGRSLVVFCAFIPLFAFREFRRVMGEEEFNRLFFRSGDRGKEHKPQS
jgi:hypothetical protein